MTERRMAATSCDMPVTTDRPGDDLFAATRWSIVRAAGGGDSRQRVVALEHLCRTYWQPLYAYVRRRGNSPEDAKDLTQEFFARLLAGDSLETVAPEKGRFRAFLLIAVKHFLANDHERRTAAKRGGGAVHLSLEMADAEALYQQAAPAALQPDRLFDRQWALTVLEVALDRLRAEHDTPEKLRLFEGLKGTLTADASIVGYAALGQQLGLSEGAVKVAAHRLRKRYRETLKSEVAGTVEDPPQVAGELHALMAAFAE
jgi:RNA polymerase sigma-70 factor (ECF subfamily)